MVVDPTWNVDYPAGDGRFLGVTDLAGTNRGQERVAELRRQRPASEKIATMPFEDASFENAMAINWDRNFVTRIVAVALELMGYDRKALFRPRLLEDPKLFLILFLIGVATSMVLGGFLLDRTVKALKKWSTAPADHTV